MAKKRYKLHTSNQPGQDEAMSRPSAQTAVQAKLMRFNPIARATPQSLTADLDAFEAGYLRNAALLWDAIEDRDDMARAVISKRKKAISRRPWDILVLEDSDEAQAHKEALEDFYNNLTGTNALDLNQRGGLSLVIRQMMDAQFKQYAVHEIIWRPTNAGLRAELKYCPLYLCENTRGRLAYVGPAGYTHGTLLDDDGWMITVGDGLMKAISVCWMFKRLSLADWMNFSEKFGVPGIHGETPAPKGSDEWNEFVDALSEFANDWIIATSQGSKINLLEVGKTGDAPFKPMVDRMDAAIARLVRGADLSTMSRDNAAGASLQGDETNLLEEDDCALISETLNTQLSRLVIKYLFGSEPKAYIEIKPTPRDDLTMEMRVDQHLHKLGVPLAKADLAERYGRTMPEEGEELAGQSMANEKPQKEEDDDDFAAARETIRAAVVADLQPLRKALAEALQGDDRELQQKLKELDQQWPKIIDQVLAGDAVEKAFERVLGWSFVDGLDVADQQFGKGK